MLKPDMVPVRFDQIPLYTLRLQDQLYELTESKVKIVANFHVPLSNIKKQLLVFHWCGHTAKTALIQVW